MPNEPERPVEKLLRACAEKRRAEAGHDFGLHPASRRMLQSEVAGVYAANARKQGWIPSSWAKIWSTLGYSFATVASLALIVKLMLPGAGPTKTIGPLARNEKVVPVVPAQAAQGASAQPNNAPSLATVQPEPSSGPLNLALEDQKTKGSQDSSGQRDLDRLEPGKDLALLSRKHSENELLSAAPAAPQAKSLMLSQNDAEVVSQLGRIEARQQLAKKELEQAMPVATWSNTLPATPILASFRVELNGQELRIIDRDGSVYSGSVARSQPAAPSAIAGAAKADSSVTSRGVLASGGTAISRMRAPSQDNFSFRVAGTNVSLNQAIVFTGQLMPLVQGLAGTDNTNRLTTTVSRTAGMPAPSPLPIVPECRVVGAAAIGGGPEIQINALPSK